MTDPFDNVLTMQSSTSFSSAILHPDPFVGASDRDMTLEPIPRFDMSSYDLVKVFYALGDTPGEAEKANGVSVRDHQASTAMAAGFNSRALRHSFTLICMEGSI